MGPDPRLLRRACLTRSEDLVDGQRELSGNAVDAHLAIISGYPYALGIMLLITVGGYLSFRRRDWL